MKKWITAVAVCGMILSGARNAAAISVQVDGSAIDAKACRVIQNTTYVPLRTLTEQLFPDAAVTWEDGQAVVRMDHLHMTARPGEQYIEANGRVLYVPYGVAAADGRVLVPVRVLAEAMGAAVEWNAAANTVYVTGGDRIPVAADYSESDLYWLARIISAESRGEPFSGQIAVGNVVLNRVRSKEFPNTIYGVIFDDRWGGQFEPVRNGSIYQQPTERSVAAAKLCLEGTELVGESLYFLAPALTQNHWIMENRTFVTVIGSHWFYI